jgi:hypothetical protein
MLDNVASISGHQPVAPYEAGVILRAEQKRIAVAKPALTAVASMRSVVNKLDYSLSHYTSELAAAWHKIREFEHQEFVPEFGSVVYWAAIILILVLEIPLNKSGLDTLGMTDFQAYFAAAFIAVVAFASAKGTARVLRQRPWIKGIRVDWIAAIVVNLVFLLMLWQIAVLRSSDSSQTGSAMAYLSLQLAGYLAAAWLTYFQIDPIGERELLNRQANGLETRVHETWQERTALAKRHNELLTSTRQALDDIASDACERVCIYRDHNIRARNGGDTPSYFRVAVPRHAFPPIALGALVDEHPETIGVISGAPDKKGNSQ